MIYEMLMTLENGIDAIGGDDDDDYHGCVYFSSN